VKVRQQVRHRRRAGKSLGDPREDLGAWNLQYNG
jgi:hypothetical protein